MPARSIRRGIRDDGGSAKFAPPLTWAQPASSLGFAGPGTVGHGIGGRTADLTVVSGDVTLSAGQTLNNTYVTGNLTLANGAVVTNCRVGKQVVSYVSQTAELRYCTLGPTSGQEGGSITTNELRRAIEGGGVKLFRCDVRGMVDGLFPTGDNITVEESWVHGQYKMASDPNQGGNPSHCDCVQVWKGQNLQFLNSRLDAFCWQIADTFDKWNSNQWPHPDSAFSAGAPVQTTAMLVSASGNSGAGPTSGVVVDGCRISGITSGHLLQFGHDQNSYQIKNSVFRNNILDPRGVPSDRKLVGKTNGATFSEWSNNKYIDPTNPTGPLLDLTEVKANTIKANW